MPCFYESDSYNDIIWIKRNNVMRPWCLQIKFNNIFNACNMFFSMCSEYIHKKKDHVPDHLV